MSSTIQTPSINFASAARRREGTESPASQLFGDLESTIVVNPAEQEILWPQNKLPSKKRKKLSLSKPNTEYKLKKQKIKLATAKMPNK